ncbi:hypothetical protein [Henriciella sp.]|uniref:hypothetical protein n=1 Tax=Henriciella sp. TaxID=1968823 RepID=UPI0026194C60|nr:hypothetical protein [Henriciella sp.]
MDTSDIIAIGALLIAIVAAGISFFSYRISRRAELGQRPKLRLEYLEGEKWSVSPEAYEYKFKVTVTNECAMPIGLKGCELRIHSISPDGREVIFPIPNEVRRGSEYVEFPMRLAAHEIISGWVLIPVPAKIVRQSQQIAYEFILLDSQNTNESFEPRLFIEKDSTKSG